MIERDKKYTYEELERIYKEAQAVVLDKTANELKEEKDIDGFFKLLVTMQNLTISAELYRVLFKGE